MPDSIGRTAKPTQPPTPGAAPGKKLSPAAERALAEAAQRRTDMEGKASVERAKESGGPLGPEPTRYGDWEKKGLTSDF
ncbi:MAG: hypothetical protein QOF09_5514 [Alphaproteobacteria bacterium]|nr:hypothetical protein [Alphaproteobacteria bacterium]